MITDATTGELRKTGISAIEDVPWGTHFCCFYETKQDLLETLVPYFKAGLENKEFCVWVLSQVLSVKEAKHTLKRAVPDLERHIADGALEIHSHDEWYLRDGRWDPQLVLQSWREKLNQALANGYAGLRASGDGGWIQNDEWMVFRQYEKEVDSLIADRRRILLCTYPLTTSSGDQVFDVACSHQVAVARRRGNWEIIEASELKEAKAEIKRLNEELEQKVEERTRELAATNEALRAEITERKLAEEAVKQAEDRIRLVIDTIPTMAWSLEPVGSLDFVSQRWMEYTGLSLEEALTEANGIVHPEDLAQALQKWASNMANGNPHEAEMRLRRVDGEYRWFLVRVSPLRDAQGKIVKWYGVSIDIEDRKRAETESRVLIDAIPQQIWSGPADGSLDYCNARWRSYMGIGLKELQGEGWQAMLHPNDRDRVLKAWHHSVVNGTPYQQEERHRGGDGNYRWFLARGVPLRDAEGRIVRWYGTNTDIEDRKRAEEELNAQALRYKTLMETSTDSIYVLGEKGDLQEANAAFLRRRGYTAAEMKGLNVTDWDAQWGPQQLQERRQKLVGRSSIFETRHRCKDGSIFDVEVCATGVRINGDQLIFCVTRDISERKQAEERLRRSEEKFKTLFRIAPVGISVLDQQLNVIDANPALERILRLSREELLSGTWRRRTYLDADGTRKSREEMPSVRAVAAKRPCSDVETGIVTEKGEIVWTQVSATPLDLPDASAVVITQDITERKLAEEALRESEQRFRELAENIHEVFWMSDPENTRMLYVSPAYEAIWGRSRETLYSSPASWMEAIHPEDKPRMIRTRTNRALALPHENSYRIVRPDGSIRWIRDRGFPVRDERGAVVRFAGIAEDITERKRTEQIRERGFSLVRATLESTADGILVVNTEGKIETFNRLFASMWRLPEEVLASKEDARALQWVLDQLTEPEKFLEKVHYLYQHPEEESFDRLLFKDGRVFERYSRPQLIGGKVAGRVWSFRDVTERGRAAEALEAANEQLRFLSRRLFQVQEEEKRHLARELHDEIGQTLTAAKINLKIVASDVPADVAGRLHDSMQLLDGLLGQVRRLSLDLRPPLLDELGLVPTLRWLVDQQSQRAGLRIRFNTNVNGLTIDPAIQTTCFRVAQEAITNIIRHSGAKKVTVVLRREEERLWLSVRDDGIGFDPAAMPQGTAPDSSLGLVSMKERMLLVRGGLEVRSAPRKGTEIRAWFPVPFGEQPTGTETS